MGRTAVSGSVASVAGRLGGAQPSSAFLPRGLWALLGDRVPHQQAFEHLLCVG